MKPYLMPADTEPEKIPAGKLLQSEIDALLRTYATKALDFRICDVSTSRTVLRNDKLYSSFSPPRTPPTKEEWIPNDECTECMVCRVTIFSMFNRRHHCRRCGRLVCAACSEDRMKVSGYGSIAVRVCTQCHAYASPRSLQLEVTCLTPPNESIEQAPIFTNRSRHNATLREEFSYEYAPSVSLCLSILQFHSQNTTLAMYLCETCTGLLHLMKPSTREIDFSFVLRMIKCLVLACKVIYDVHGVESTTLDEICTQVNLLSILVNNNCCHLIPEKPLVGQNALRQLRDSLLKEERWSLALEVSTKAGLDYNSVWTVWGKACLKAGAWSEARTIFTKCHFDKRENSTLIDILQILQSDMYNGGDLSTRLSRLKSPLTSTEPSASDSPSYTECLYYLHTYGSDALILRFYIHRENLRQALDYVRQKTVSPELFVEHVFLRCLKLGMTESLFNLMEEFDVSLLSWKHYLRTVCSHCERSGLLNVLYAIQLRTHDHVRAAITCVRFYLKGAGSYAALKEREYQLTRARGHLNDRRKSKQVNHLAMQISPPELNKQLALLDYQTKLVYVIVSTNQELANRFTSRVATLFGGVDEKAHLLADVLSLETGGAMEGKFRQLCRETVTALSLNPLSIYSELFSLLAKQGRIPDIKELLVSLKHSLGNACDDVLVAAIRQKPPQVEQLISVVSKIPLQISLFIETGKLKSAYLLCVKHNRLDEIRTIATRAKALNQTAILNICLKKIAMEEAKESGKNISSDKALSQQAASSQSPRTNAKLGRTIFVRPDSMSLISSQSSSSDSFASLLSEIRLAEEKSLTGSKTPTAPRVNFQLPESSKSNPSSSSKSGRISTSPRERSRRYPGSSNSPAQQESIASVLKMYEENRLRESQMLGRVELGDSDEGVSKSQQNSPSERRLKSVRTSKASPQTPQDRSVSFIGESSISELPGSKVSSIEQSLENSGTRARSDLDSSTTPSSFSRQSSHSSMLGLTSDASTSQTSSSRILNRSARSQAAFSPNLVGQRDLDSVEQESIASVLRRYEENRLRESKQVQPKKDKDSLR